MPKKKKEPQAGPPPGFQPRPQTAPRPARIPPGFAQPPTEAATGSLEPVHPLAHFPGFTPPQPRPNPRPYNPLQHEQPPTPVRDVPHVQPRPRQATPVHQLVRPMAAMQVQPQRPVLPVQQVSSGKEYRTPQRPGFGSDGKVVQLRANHFALTFNSNLVVHQYDVSITPDVTPRKLRRAIIRELIRMEQAVRLGNRLPAFDGQKSLYTAGPLPFQEEAFNVPLLEEEDREAVARGEQPRRPAKQFKVVLKVASRIPLSQLQQFMDPTRPQQLEIPQAAIQALDIVLREYGTFRYQPVGRSLFHPNFGTSDLGEGAVAWRGYYQSVRPTQLGLALNVDLSVTAFHEPMPVVDFVRKLLRGADISKGLSPRDNKTVRKAINKLRVEVTHMRPKTIRYRVSGLTAEPAAQLSFAKDGQPKKLVDYFLEEYNKRLQYPMLPCVTSGQGDKVKWLPMEFCLLMPGQKYDRKLSDTQQTKMIAAAAQGPGVRERNNTQIVKDNNYGQDPYAREFGLSVSTQMATVRARVLNPPKLKYGQPAPRGEIMPRSGSWNMINQKLAAPARLDNWVLVNFSRMNNQGAIAFATAQVNKCAEMGMIVNPSPMVPVRSCHPNAMLQEVRKLFQQALQQTGQAPQMMFVIRQEKSATYGDLKKLCETELGVITQCVLSKHAATCKGQYLENVALKINAKMGGTNVVLCQAVARSIPHFSDAPTIVFGADVTHPLGGDTESPSIAAVVASVDWPHATRYAGLVASQASREEIIQGLYTEHRMPGGGMQYGGMVIELLKRFYGQCRYKPQRILFFRDGVSEGQFAKVKLHELDAIYKACQRLEAGYMPSVTYVVVQKRHKTRLYPTDRNVDNKSGNILPGTVVDSGITHPTDFDFYLNSHAGIQGTNRPVHYNVLWDENRFTADQLQNLINSMCYTYARCTRSVSVVPPAYYAHLLAFRARAYADVADSASSTSTGGTPTVVPVPEVKESIKFHMFYC